MTPDPLNDNEGLEGRHLRAALGGLVILAVVGVFVFHAWRGVLPPIGSLALDFALLVTGWMLIDRDSAKEVLARIGEWLPWRRG